MQNAPTTPLQIALGAVVRQDPGGTEVLICRRLPRAVRAGLWEFPGGKVEPGESPARAAAREVLEETGIALSPATAQPVCELTHRDPDAPRESSLHFTMFVWDAPPGATAQPLGCAECKWERVDALERYDWPKANAALISSLRAWLERPRTS